MANSAQPNAEPTPASTMIRFPAGDISSELLSMLEARGCISEPNLTPPNLTNSIYPLYSMPNFPTLSKADYAYIEPALRLASHFIAEEVMAEFWLALQHGSIESEWRSGEEVRYLRFEEPQNEAKAQMKGKLKSRRESPNMLGKIARGLKVVELGVDVLEDSTLFGRAFVHQGKEDKKLKVKTEDVGFRIGLHPDVFRYIRELSIKPKVNFNSQDLRFQFLLARTLVREAVRVYFFHTHQDAKFGEEPFYDIQEQELSEEPDLRASWEMFAYGCKIQQWHTARPTDPKQPRSPSHNARSVFLHTSHTADTGIDQMLAHTTVLPMGWMHSWFLQSTWDSIREKGRIDGRPNIGDAPVLVGTDISRPEDVEPRYEWALENYNHQDLVQHGGYDTANEENVEWLYGRLEGDKAKDDEYIIG